MHGDHHLMIAVERRETRVTEFYLTQIFKFLHIVLYIVSKEVKYRNTVYYDVIMTSQPINPPKPHQKVELVTLIKFAKFHHYTPNNKKVMKSAPPGCDEPKKPGQDRD